MNGLWGMGQMMFSKYIVVVDEDCDVHDTSAVLFRWMSNTDPQRDSTYAKGPTDALDHAQTIACMGSHVGYDATSKLPGEGYAREWPELLRMDAAVKARVAAMRGEVC
jgi:4-hydroxy-3-polyprenylbenzoate decarboxylase